MTGLESRIFYKVIIRITGFILGFIFFVGMAISVISAYGRFHFFGKNVDSSKPFQEIEYTENIVSGEGKKLFDYINAYHKLKAADSDEKVLFMYDAASQNIYAYTLEDLMREHERKLSGVIFGFTDYFDGSIVSRENIYSDYNDLRDTIDRKCSIVLEYHAKTDSTYSYYFDKKGKKVEYDYANDTIWKYIDEMPVKVDFVFGIDLNSVNNIYSIPRAIYSYCRIITQPVPTLVIFFFFFMLIVIFLSATTGVYFDEDGVKQVKLRLIDKIPAEIFLVIFGTIVFFVLDFLRHWFMPYGYLIKPSGTVDYDSPITVVALLLILFAAYFLLAFMFLSFVRRIRTGTLLRNLLIVKLYEFLYGLYKNITKDLSARLLFFTKLFIFGVVNVFLAAILLLNVDYDNFNVYLYIPIGLVIILDIIGIYKLVKYTNHIEVLIDLCKAIENGDFKAKVETDQLSGSCRKLGESLNHLGGALDDAVEASTKDEKLKAELITNVSHDIKTPLTSIINYIDLIKREEIDNPKVVEYINILDTKSQRLKQLTLDLIEASKVSTGNIEFEYVDLNLTELIQQAVAEFDDKFSENSLEVILDAQEVPLIIHADGARIFRIIENLFQNACKYAIQGSRVYMNLSPDGENARFSIKNVSREMLNISPEELTERFVRGDKSRFTEGSGLGLSIARNLTELQGGKFELSIDGDLFRVDLVFPLVSLE